MWIKVRGERWSLRDDAELDPTTLGECDHCARVIRVPIDGDQLHELDTIIHEVLHACYPDLSEDAVSESAESIAVVLFKLKWRKSDD